MSFPSRILLRLLCNLLFLWGLTEYATALVRLTGGIPALLLMGFLLTAIDLLARPLLMILTFPLRLFLSLLNIFVINGIALALLVLVSREFPPDILTFTLLGGVKNFAIVLAIFSARDVLLRFFMR